MSPVCSMTPLPLAGMMSQYGSGWKPSVSTGLLELLLWKSAAVRGFFLPHHSRLYKKHLQLLAGQWMQGRLHVSLDASKFMYACYLMHFRPQAAHPLPVLMTESDTEMTRPP